jgi:L-ascorbate metabolism protein UlaG (beta-lactamase superfamily)
MPKKRESSLSPQTEPSLFGRRFRNPNPAFQNPTPLKVARWLAKETARRRGFPSFGILKSPGSLAEARADRDADLLRENRSLTSFTWVGHSSFLIQVDGLNILTDPVWSGRLVPGIGPQRFHAPGLAFEALPSIDLVVISHDHYDHLDLRTLRRLGPVPLYCVPIGLKSLLRRKGLDRVEEFSWWDSLRLASLTIRCVPAQHFSVRGVLDRDRTLWAGWSIEGSQQKVYFGGDTGFYQRQFEEIAQVCGPLHVAILPVGAYRPEWLMQPVHMGPLEAILALRILGARWFIPCHWGTFRLSEEPLEEPIHLLRQAMEKGDLQDTEVWIPSPGLTRYLAG